MAKALIDLKSQSFRVLELNPHIFCLSKAVWAHWSDKCLTPLWQNNRQWSRLAGFLSYRSSDCLFADSKACEPRDTGVAAHGSGAVHPARAERGRHNRLSLFNGWENSETGVSESAVLRSPPSPPFLLLRTPARPGRCSMQLDTDNQAINNRHA